MFLFLTYFNSWIITILSKERKPDNFESRNTLTLSFTNIQGLSSNFVVCEYFLESNSRDILILCKTNLDDFWQFFCEGVSNLQGLYYSYAWCCSLCGEGLSFALELSLENSADSCLCFWPALLYLVSYFFFFYQSPSSSLSTVLGSILFDINEVLWINISAYLFVFGDFNIHHKDWLTYSGRADRAGEL